MDTSKVATVDGLDYDEKLRIFRLNLSYTKNRLNEDLVALYGSTPNAMEILTRVSRQFYNYVYDKKTYPEDFDKKQYLLITDENVARVSREIMFSHLESTVLTRRDLLLLEAGVDLDGAKLIEDYDTHLDEYRFAVDTMSIFNQHRVLRYKERMNLKEITSSMIRVGY